MVRRDLPAEPLRDYDMVMSDLQRRFNELFRSFGMPAWEPETIRWFTLARGQEITVDVREHGDEVMVAADLPGVEKEDIHVKLLDPKILEISIDQRQEKEEKKEDYYMHERFYRSRSRTVVLPAEVTEEGVMTSFRNGVLELRLKKTKESHGKEIQIQ